MCQKYWVFGDTAVSETDTTLCPPGTVRRRDKKYTNK